MRRLVYIMMFLPITQVIAQVEFNIAYELPSYEYVHGLVQDSNGDYIISGTSGSYEDNTNAQAFMFRVDSLGAWKWLKYYGTDQVDNGQNVSLMDNGDLGVCGYSDGNNPNDYDIFLLRTDNDGNEIWMKFYGGDSWDIANYSAKTQDDGFIVAGKTYSYTNGGSDAYLIRTDVAGDTLWTRHFGGELDDEFFGVVATMDGGFVAIGYSETETHGLKDAYLVKVDANGNTVWTNHFGGSRDDIGYSVDETIAGEIIWTGSNTSDPGSNGNHDIAIFRLTADGDSIHSSVQTFHGGEQFDEIPTVIRPTMDNGYIVASFTEGFWADNNDFMLMRVNDHCQFSWQKLYSCVAFTEETVGDMIVASDNGYAIANSTTHGNGPLNIQLVKTDINGDGISVDCITGVNDPERTSLVFGFYPNPTTQTLNITIGDRHVDDKPIASIVDATGRVMASGIQIKPNRENQIDVSHLSPGLYFVSMTVEGYSVGRPFIKE